jgi:hypothetical protein
MFILKSYQFLDSNFRPFILVLKVAPISHDVQFSVPHLAEKFDPELSRINTLSKPCTQFGNIFIITDKCTSQQEDLFLVSHIVLQNWTSFLQASISHHFSLNIERLPDILNHSFIKCLSFTNIMSFQSCCHNSDAVHL